MMYKLIDAKEIKKALSWLSKYWDRPLHPEYYHARTVDEAISLLDEYGKEAKLMAGGVDLVGLMKNRVIVPRALVNIKPIARLKHITGTDSGLFIGALTLINDLERSPMIKDKYPLLYEAAHSIGSPQVRNMSTVAGNLCQDVRCWYYRRSPSTGITYNCRRKSETGTCYAADGENQYHAIIGGNKCLAICPSDMATVLLALDATLSTVSTSGGRTLAIDELYTCLGTVLEPAELVTEIQVPAPESGTKQRFLKFRVRNAIDYAIVSVAVVVKSDRETVRDARIVLGGVSAEPYRVLKAEEVLKGERLSESVAAEAARIALNDAQPLSKNGYKVQIAETLVKRALLE
ncbi:MAG: xanthine dehydrogenase family protein subunit M [Dehalococcoidia bacterium]|nr:xanthine dehydrogenase family protein subunit M [Dehalococcoidia bacterium]